MGGGSGCNGDGGGDCVITAVTVAKGLITQYSRACGMSDSGLLPDPPITSTSESLSIAVGVRAGQGQGHTHSHTPTHTYLPWAGAPLALSSSHTHAHTHTHTLIGSSAAPAQIRGQIRLV